MKKRIGCLALSLFAGACGGGAEVAAPRFTLQTEFDFTRTEDRGLFAERELAYRESMRPYAIYEVTGLAPALEGPYVEFAATRAYAMLCSANGFRVEAGRAESRLHLIRRTEQQRTDLISVRLEGRSRAGCLTAKDDFAERI